MIQDFGSGLNYHKRGLQQLIKRIGAGEVGRLVLTHKDRLLRFGSEIIFSLCELTNTEVVIINQGQQPASFEEELTQDVLEIITVFSARLYGSRSRKNRQMIEACVPRRSSYDRTARFQDGTRLERCAAHRLRQACRRGALCLQLGLGAQDCGLQGRSEDADGD